MEAKVADMETTLQRSIEKTVQLQEHHFKIHIFAESDKRPHNRMYVQLWHPENLSTPDEVEPAALGFRSGHVTSKPPELTGQ
ncbi:hypothetical protein TNCV_2555741 [Trichonephila clavipes]|nr:hypothetical protein TNCV_2555741 [Trichonephila clavipes]